MRAEDREACRNESRWRGSKRLDWAEDPSSQEGFSAAPNTKIETPARDFNKSAGDFVERMGFRLHGRGEQCSNTGIAAIIPVEAATASKMGVPRSLHGADVRDPLLGAQRGFIRLKSDVHWVAIRKHTTVGYTSGIMGIRGPYPCKQRKKSSSQ